MHNIGVFTMSSQELTRKEILDRVINREVNQVKAAKILKISDRWLRKLLFDYKQIGVAALISKKRGKKSNRAYDEKFKLNVLSLVKEKYHDFGPTFAAEKLEEYDGIKINHETLRLWMIAEGMHTFRSKRKARIHQSRARRSCVGAPRKACKLQLVRIQSRQSVASSLEPSPACVRVTEHMKPGCGMYQAAMKVNVLSSEIVILIEADVIYISGKQHGVRRYGKSYSALSESEAVA